MCLNNFYLTGWRVSQEVKVQVREVSQQQRIDQCFVSSCSGGILWKGLTGQKQAEQAAGGGIRPVGRGAKPSGEEAPHFQLPGPFIRPSPQRISNLPSY